MKMIAMVYFYFLLWLFYLIESDSVSLFIKQGKIEQLILLLIYKDLMSQTYLNPPKLSKLAKICCLLNNNNSFSFMLLTHIFNLF